MTAWRWAIFGHNAHEYRPDCSEVAQMQFNSKYFYHGALYL